MTSPRDSAGSLAEQYSSMPAYGDTVAVGSFSGERRCAAQAARLPQPCLPLLAFWPLAAAA